MAVTFATRPPAYDPVKPSDVDASVQITQSTVNVGEFGWTTNDMTSVKDIVRYVATAQAAAESADLNAQYVQSQMDILDAGVSTVNGALSTITNAQQQIAADKQYMDTKTAEAASSATAANQAATNALNSANKALASENVIKTYALAALYSFKDQGTITDDDYDILVSEGTVQKLRLTKPTTNLNLNPFPTDPANTARQITLILEQGTGSNKITFNQLPDPDDSTAHINVVNWNNGRPPRLSYEVDKADVITLLTTDKGKHWYGFFNGGWFNVVT